MTLRNIRLQIAFDGTNYSGWQRQKNTPTIQGAIEDCLSTMTCAKVTLHGAGRTDAGVHALAMTANFSTISSIPCDGFMSGLNSMLAYDIRILAAEEVSEEFHSRFSATGKIYRYTFCTSSVQQPTERLYCTRFPVQINTEAVILALEHIKGTHDFSSFEGSGSRDLRLDCGRGAVRTLHSAIFGLHPNQEKTYFFQFIGDGFLRHMVRNLVGTLFEVGSGKISPDKFAMILKAHNRGQAGPTAPANGLFLEKVSYEPITNCPDTLQTCHEKKITVHHS